MKLRLPWLSPLLFVLSLVASFSYASDHGGSQALPGSESRFSVDASTLELSATKLWCVCYDDCDVAYDYCVTVTCVGQPSFCLTSCQRSLTRCYTRCGNVCVPA